MIWMCEHGKDSACCEEDVLPCPRCGEGTVHEHGTFCEICLSELEA